MKTYIGLSSCVGCELYRHESTCYKQYDDTNGTYSFDFYFTHKCYATDPPTEYKEIPQFRGKCPVKENQTEVKE